MDQAIFSEVEKEEIKVEEEDAPSFIIADSSLDPLYQTLEMEKGREIPGEIKIDQYMYEVKEENEIKVEEEEVPPSVFTDDPLASCQQEPPWKEGKSEAREIPGKITINQFMHEVKDENEIKVEEEEVPPSVFTDAPLTSCQQEPSWEEGKSEASQLMGDSQMDVSEETAFSPSYHPEHLSEDHQNFQDTVLQQSAFCSDYHQNRQATHEENIRCPATLSTTTFCPLPSPISTSAALPAINTTSSFSFPAPEIPSEAQGSAEPRENEIVFTDNTSDQVLKALKEKNAIFDHTIAMMVQEQEKHDKQLRMMQEHHKNQMKTMQEHHNMWLKIQEENFSQMLQIQRSQTELQTSIEQLWQDISNNK